MIRLWNEEDKDHISNEEMIMFDVLVMKLVTDFMNKDEENDFFFIG